MKHHEITTDSRLKVWWLSRFRGYVITHSRMIPQKVSFGRVVYQRLWILSRKKA